MSEKEQIYSDWIKAYREDFSWKKYLRLYRIKKILNGTRYSSI